MNAPECGLFSRRVKKRLQEADVFWVYQGKPRKDAPHALLASCKHSDGYIDVGKVLKEQPSVRMEFAGFILFALKEAWEGSFTRVVGADTSSTDLAKEVAGIVGAKYIRMLKTEDSKGKRQVWSAENTPLQDGETILHLEELITTSFSALQVREGIRSIHPEMKLSFVPFLPVAVERSDPDNRVVRVEKSVILPLLRLSIRNYDSGACPYCAAGSEAIKPKEGDNWSRLTGKQ